MVLNTSFSYMLPRKVDFCRSIHKVSPINVLWLCNSCCIYWIVLHIHEWEYIITYP